MALVERDAARQELTKSAEVNDKLQKPECRNASRVRTGRRRASDEREEAQLKLREDLEAKFDELAGLGQQAHRGVRIRQRSPPSRRTTP